MPPRTDPAVTAQSLAARLHNRQKTFKRGGNNAKLLALYLSKFPEFATNAEASQAIGGVNANTPISRLRADLIRCFQTDRSLWNDQVVLRLSDTGLNQAHSLELHPLSSVLSPTSRIWFHQCLRVPI